MNENEDRLEEEAEEIRRETAEGSPEVAEHDRVAELERQLEEANSSMEEFGERTHRFQMLRRRLQEEGVQLVFDGQAAEGAGDGTGSETDE